VLGSGVSKLTNTCDHDLAQRVRLTVTGIACVAVWLVDTCPLGLPAVWSRGANGGAVSRVLARPANRVEAEHALGLLLATLICS
jgi:hypothetical protein